MKEEGLEVSECCMLDRGDGVELFWGVDEICWSEGGCMWRFGEVWGCVRVGGLGFLEDRYREGWVKGEEG